MSVLFTDASLRSTTSLHQKRESTLLDIGNNSDRLIQLFRDTRARTQNLVSTLKPDDYVVQTAFYTSPAKWHIGHVSWIYEVIMGKIDSEYGFKKDEISEYLNSYYQQFGTPYEKGHRGMASRPTTQQMLEYFDHVSTSVEQFIAKYRHVIDVVMPQNTDKNDTIQSNDPKIEISRLLEMGINHECQHQELLVYDLQHMLAERYTPPCKNILKPPHITKSVDTSDMLRIDGGLYNMGYNGSNYCYDIELPEHTVFLNPYMIAKYLVTNQQYLEFINDGGYETYRYWLADGWDIVQKNGWDAPMYWEKNTTSGNDGEEEDVWHIHDFTGYHAINLQEPVSHVSYYEAAAYCKWAQKRLPTEAEWEKAACWNDSLQKKHIFPWGDDAPTPQRCNLLESDCWSCTDVGSYPLGISAYGCHQMIGDVWEWTSSEFVGYPGFQSGFDEYNDKWFANQKVLRGGSFGTPAASIRASYRNFFKLDERWMISGFRCAQDDTVLQ